MCALSVSLYSQTRKYEIEHWSRSSKTINRSSDSFQINHVTLKRRDSSKWWNLFESCALTTHCQQYGHVILVSCYPVLTPVSWPYCEYPMWIYHGAWNTPPFLLIVSPTPHVQSVDAYVCQLSIMRQPNKKRLTIFYEYGALSHTGKARRSPAITIDKQKTLTINWDSPMLIRLFCNCWNSGGRE